MVMHDPRVPETVEGWSILHQMFRIRWETWRALPDADGGQRAASTVDGLSLMPRGEEGAPALPTLLGHKGDLMLIHFRRDFEALQAAQLAVSRLAIAPYLEPTSSYVSIVELGMYEMTAQIHGRLKDKGLAAGSPEFEKAFDAEMDEQRRRVIGRLFQEVPPRRHVCFYPFNMRRGGHKKLVAAPAEERGSMMLRTG